MVQIWIGVTDGKRNKIKNEDKSKPQNHNLVSVIDLVILNMHIKFEILNSYTDWADMMEKFLG